MSDDIPNINRAHLELMKLKLLEIKRSGNTVTLSDGQIFGFDLWEWLADAEVREAGGVSEHPCGTTCCAIGAAMLDPRFQKLGLTSDNNACPLYQGLSHWDAVNAFFGLTNEQAVRLFSASEYLKSERENPSAVIARIDELLTATK